MKCALCPVVVAGETCLGESIPRLCELARTRNDYRRQLARLAHAKGAFPALHDLGDVLAEVAHCPQRGPVVPATFQPECGCSELTECRAGRGARPGLVALGDCLACAVGRRERSGASDPAAGA